MLRDFMLRANIHQCYCFHKNSTNSQEAWCPYEQDTRLGFHQKLRNLLHTLELFLKIHCYTTISLCCYPTVNGSFGNLSQDTSTAPHFFAIQLFQKKYLGSNSSAVSLYLHICRTSWQDTQNCISNHAFLVLFPSIPPKFWGRVEEIFQNSPRRYLSSRRLKSNIWIFHIAFWVLFTMFPKFTTWWKC